MMIEKLPVPDPAPAASRRERLTKALACAALAPGLRSILVFDADVGELRSLAATLRGMLRVTTARSFRLLPLNAAAADDALWGEFIFSSASRRRPLIWRRGLLQDERAHTRPRLVLLPDLTRLDLPVARSILLLADSPVAHLERHGRQKVWQPNLCWLAACPRAAVGQVSPHLLDRFTLKLQGGDLGAADREEELRQALSRGGAKAEAVPKPLPWFALAHNLRQAMDQHPKFTADAWERILQYYPAEGTRGMRREISLARLAHADARLDAISAVTGENVDNAAAMIDLTRLPGVAEPRPMPGPAQQRADAGNLDLDRLVDRTTGPEGKSALPTIRSPQPGNADSGVSGAGNAAKLPAAPLNPVSDPTDPEDLVPVEREAASLRLPAGSLRTRRLHRGTIIGVEHALTLDDLALTNTLLEAAKFQAIRLKKGLRQRGEFKIFAGDWRRYRRAALPERLLVLVLDHTCLRDQSRDWEAALAPHLHAAYVTRAALRVVQVGWEDGGDGLQARLIQARSLLAPQLHEAFLLRPGKATPLAHGLVLALQTMRHELHHGRNPATRCLLLVLSDGRGNVPLEVSHFGARPGRVSREGVTDALAKAEAIAALDRVEVIVLNPEPPQYPELPLDLARALGASVQTIASFPDSPLEE